MAQCSSDFVRIAIHFLELHKLITPYTSSFLTTFDNFDASMPSSSMLVDDRDDHERELWKAREYELVPVFKTN